MDSVNYREGYCCAQNLKHITNSGERGSSMYSPKIKKDLIPVLYKIAKQERKPMTVLVDEMLRAEIAKRNGRIEASNNEASSKEVKKTSRDRRS